MRTIVAATAALLASCASVPTPNPQDQFFAALSSHCGTSLSGRLVSSDPQDADMAGKPMVARFASCSANEVRINFAVGDDTSRNWVISRTPGGLRLKHIHLHKDGTEDELSRYGGDTATVGTARRQEFPADAFSKDLFTRRNIPASVTNVWAVEVRPREFFAYELRRPGRFFRVELTRNPPPSGS
jgi:hypothetical protein